MRREEQIEGSERQTVKNTEQETNRVADAPVMPGSSMNGKLL